ncbi:hypothetical protein CN380_15215 [Bacillus sp. AFS017274]|nr:hypothetical protein CN380_15215 [Bacillus sp. AFS017274]
MKNITVPKTVKAAELTITQLGDWEKLVFLQKELQICCSHINMLIIMEDFGIFLLMVGKDLQEGVPLI